MAADANSIKAGAAHVSLTLQNRLSGPLKKVAGEIKMWADGMQAIGQKMVGFGLAGSTAFGGAIALFASTGNELNRMSQRTGISVSALSELGYAAQQSGASLDDLEMGIKGMSRLLQTAANGGEEALTTLRQLGLSFSELRALTPEQMLARFADAFSAVGNPIQRAALAMNTFGRNGRTLLPVLENGSKGINALRQEARDLGLQVSSEDANAATKLSQAWNSTTAVLKAATFQVGAALAPAITEVLGSVKSAIGVTVLWVKENKGLIATVAATTVAVAATGAALYATGMVFRGVAGFVKGLSYITYALGRAWAFTTGMFAIAKAGALALAGVLGIVSGGASILPFAIGAVAIGLTALAGYMIYTSESGRRMLASMSGTFNAMKETAVAAFGGIMDAMQAGDLSAALAIGLSGLKSLWVQFRVWFAKEWDGLSNGLAAMWLDTMEGLDRTLLNLFIQLRRGWMGAMGEIEAAWEAMQARIGGLDADAAAEAVRARVRAEQRALDRVGNRADRNIRSNYNDQRNTIAEDQRRTDRGRDQEVADSRAELNASLLGAELARTLRPFENLDIFGGRDAMATPIIRGKAASAGTFSAAAAEAMGQSSAADRTAKATETIATVIQRMERAGGLVWS